MDTALFLPRCVSDTIILTGILHTRKGKDTLWMVNFGGTAIQGVEYLQREKRQSQEGFQEYTNADRTTTRN